MNRAFYLTEKIHGTSARYGKVLEAKESTFIQRVMKKIGFNVETQFRYVYLAGTRRVELNKREKNSKGFYGTDSFRHKVMETVWENLRKGEVLYGEIVGYTDSGAPIQHPGKTKAVGDKAFIKRYGELNHYKYGCVEGTCELYIYRIVNVNEDGLQFDLPWPQVKKRCEQLGLKHVPEISSNPFILMSTENLSNFETLERMVKESVDGPSLLDSSQCREGVCVRIEDEFGINVLKEKSWAFKMMEEGLKDQGEIDIEEAQELIISEEDI